MVELKIDTHAESTASLTKLISFLQHVIAEKEGSALVTNEQESVSTTQTQQSPSTGMFDMFSEQQAPSQQSSPQATFQEQPSYGYGHQQQPSVSQTQQQPSSQVPSQDMFSMFSSEQPSSAPQAYTSSKQPAQPEQQHITAHDLLANSSTKDPRDVPVAKKKREDFFGLRSF
jgi:hypothetical protein